MTTSGSTLTEADRREIGQHFVCGFRSTEINDHVKTLIRDYHVGNIILLGRNLESVKQAHGLVKGLQQFAKDCGHARPLMIGIDQENGLVSAFSASTKVTQFPGAMALAATGDPEIARLCSLGAAKEMKLAGINWAYSPVADVNSEPRNPVIGIRSFGDDPHDVAKYAMAVSKGLTEGGIAPTAKHFPGHGDTDVDSHTGLPVIQKTESQLYETELIPFRALVESEVATIMTGHIALPNVVEESDRETPCSCSPSMTRGFLRGTLEFRGVIVTDCLEMAAVSEKYGTQKAAVLSLQAGADVAMICHTTHEQIGAVKNVHMAVEGGVLSLEELRESGRRIDELKARFAGTWEGVLGDLDEKKLAEVLKENAELSKKAYATSTAVIRGPGPVLVETPKRTTYGALAAKLGKKAYTASTAFVKGSGPVLVLLTPKGTDYGPLAAGVRRYQEHMKHIIYEKPWRNPDDDIPSEVVTALARVALLIFVTEDANRRDWQLVYLRKLRKHIPSGTTVKLLAGRGPYDLLNAPDIEYECIGSFEHTPPALEVAAAVILGERAATGRVPVKV